MNFREKSLFVLLAEAINLFVWFHFVCSPKWQVQTENLLAKTEFQLVCGSLATVNVEQWNLLSKSAELTDYVQLDILAARGPQQWLFSTKRNTTPISDALTTSFSHICKWYFEKINTTSLAFGNTAKRTAAQSTPTTSKDMAIQGIFLLWALIHCDTNPISGKDDLTITSSGSLPVTFQTNKWWLQFHNTYLALLADFIYSSLIKQQASGRTYLQGNHLLFLSNETLSKAHLNARGILFGLCGSLL